MPYVPKNKLGADRARLRDSYPHLHVVRSRHDREKLFIYYAPAGKPRVRLLADPWKSPAEFREEYEAAKRGEPKPEPEPRHRSRVGTWNAAIDDYMQSAKYVTKADATKRAYRRFIEAIRAGLGSRLMSQTDPWELYKTHDGIVQTSPTEANTFLSVLSAIVHIGRLHRWVPAHLDLLYGIEHQQIERNSFRPYTDQEIEQWRDTHGPETMARKAFELAYWLGLANSDLIRLAPCHIDDLGNVSIARQKTGTVQTNNINLNPALRQVIDSFPPPPDGSPVDMLGRSTVPFLSNQYGKPFQSSTFRKQWRRWANEAGVPEDLKIHGARSTLVTDMIDAGVAQSDGMKVSGHADPRVYERTYGKHASVQRAAARAQTAVVAARARKGGKGSNLRAVV